MNRDLFGLLTAFVLALAAPAAAQDAIGSVSRIQGEASSAVAGTAEALGLGSSVFLNQEVSTGDAARLELKFLDGTQLTLGEKAKMILDTFVYNPAEGTGKLKMAVTGAFRFVSGQVTKQPDSEVAVTTPVATVGIRGTEFWGGPIDDQALGVFLIEGEVTVTNAAWRAGPRHAWRGHQYRNARCRPQAGHHLAAGQGRPRNRHSHVPVTTPLALTAVGQVLSDHFGGTKRIRA